MKKGIVLAALAAAWVLNAGVLFAADPVEGYWVSVDEKTGKITAGWEIYQSGGKLYGKVLGVVGHPQDVKADKCKESYPDFPVAGKVNQMPVRGTPWIFGLTMNRAGQWSGGSVVDPETGNLYKCRITFRPADNRRYPVDTLEMRGEIGLGIGRSQFWRKSTRAEVEGLR
ncbi:MAG: DUF2147 domain-containing protein [Spirochaetaceae bacterium]|jgi:uncharacterized protein (DUF2147 family)|nr:DUF2147 domain-containing protein [Spirochaetaceae bacterium]